MKFFNILDLVKRGEEVPLSDKDIREILDDNVNVINYMKFFEIERLEDVMGNDLMTPVIFLYPVNAINSGHWVCFFFNKIDNVLCYYNSYGLHIDADTRISNFPGIHTKDGISILYQLIVDFCKRNGTLLDINHYQHQKLKNDMNTCGRYCCSRIIFRDLSNSEFNKMIVNKKMTPDETVTFFTLLFSFRHGRGEE